MLEIRKVYKSYGKKRALTNVSYQFGTGVYGLLGPNGAGKSTLLQIITNNLKMDLGQVLYDGTDIHKNQKQYKSALGYVPQIQDMYENFTALEFLEYMAALKGIPKAQVLPEIKRVLKIVGLIKNAMQKLGTFSGGMKQRVLIAQALLGSPRVLILDEPTAGLDPKERIRLRNHLSRLAETTTVILATHVVSDVESIAKDILLLGDGRIRQHGSVEELCSGLAGKVFEGEISADDLPQLERTATLSNIQELSGGRIEARCIAEPEKMQALPFTFQTVAPNLQEVYLYTFAMH